MTEYIIVVALIAIAAIGVVTMFGGNMRALFGAATAALAGDTNAQVHSERPTAAEYGKKDLRTAFQQH
jgi:Flp pilus assembly pilin Flp